MKPTFRATVAFLLCIGVAQGAWTAPAKPPVKGAVEIEVQNAVFHVMDGVMLSVIRLDAWMVPKPGQMVTLDQKNSFVMQIVSGETRLKASDMSALMNQYLLPHAKAPIKNMAVSFEGNSILIKGQLQKGIPVPFEAKGTVTLADESDIRVHLTEMKAAGVLKKGLLDFLGIKLENVAQPGKESRFHIEGNDIILPIAALFPPPRISGKVTAVRIEGDSLVQVFGPPDAKMKPPPTPAKNYVYFRGGRMRFGKLTMEDVDLELVDQDQSNAFDFSLDHYYDQLTAGYSKTLPSMGLVVHMPDYATVAKKPDAAASGEAKK